MTPPVHHSHLPPSEGNQNHQTYLHPFFPTYETASFPYPIFLDTSHQGGSHDSAQQHSHHRQQEAYQHLPVLTGRSRDHSSSLHSTSLSHDEESSKNCITPLEDDPPKSGSPPKWMSSKMRFMKRMMNSDRIVSSKPRKKTQVLQLQDQQLPTGDGNGSHMMISTSTGTIRVCSDCNTTKTPLWRSGPRGPKSLCNACGIRQRKARRAMAAAAAAASASGGVIPADTPAKVRNEKSLDSDCTVPFKKRCKFTSVQTREELHFDDLTISASKNSAFHQVFPQDEKEAAILLMALSCGLICG